MTGLRIRLPDTTPPPTVPVAARRQHWWNKDLSWGRSALTDRHKEGLYQELGLLLGAGVDIKSALDLQVQQHQGTPGQALQQIRDTVVQGSSLSAAMEATGMFSLYECHSIRIGEETGRLALILQDLVAYYSRKIRQRRLVIQALAYPVVVLTTAVAAVVFMLNFIVPMFADVFRQFGGKLPDLTKLIVRLSGLVQAYWGVGALLLLGLVLTHRALATRPAYQRASSRLILRLPLVGGIVRRVYLARMCSSLALLTGAHVPLTQALQLARQMLGFWPVISALAQIEAQVTMGCSLHESLRQFPVFDARMIALLKIGEEVNKLDHFFTILARQYSDEVEYQTSLLSTALEPLIIIFLGLVVGIVLVAMYLPIFQMSNAIG